MTNFKQFKLTPLRLKLETDYIYKIANDLNNIIINYAGDIFPHDKGAVANYLCLKIMRLVLKLNDFDSLGQNARRMLEIGIVQDELVKLGFKSGIKTISTWNIFTWDKRLFLSIYFDNDAIEIVIPNGDVAYRFYYTSPTCQQDLLNKVKELICES